MGVPAEILPANEPERLSAVRRYEILDTPPDGAFERLTGIAARTFEVPISIVSIVDHDRIWFKSAHGLPGVQQIDRVPGLCASAIMQSEVWVVEEADRDPRALANPLVAGEFGLRFYAGAPLLTHDGYNLGTICVIDRTPRTVSADEAATLSDLAAVVVDELELRLAARREADRLEQTRSDFVVTASHQLRTPLTAVLGAAKTLGAAADRLPELERELVAMLEQQSERLGEIVDKILLAAELDQPGMALALELHDAEGFAREAIELTKPTAGSRQLVLSCEADLPPVIADAARLRHVLVNLIENAVKYSADETTIQLEVDAVAGRIRFLVHDEGIGIPHGDQKRIFDKFVRLDAGMSTGISGTGLGLHIAQQFVRRMGGSLSVSSGPGRGSTFVVELPAAAR